MATMKQFQGTGFLKEPQRVIPFRVPFVSFYPQSFKAKKFAISVGNYCSKYNIILDADYLAYCLAVACHTMHPSASLSLIEKYEAKLDNEGVYGVLRGFLLANGYPTDGSITPEQSQEILDSQTVANSAVKAAIEAAGGEAAFLSDEHLQSDEADEKDLLDEGLYFVRALIPTIREMATAIGEEARNVVDYSAATAAREHQQAVDYVVKKIFEGIMDVRCIAFIFIVFVGAVHLVYRYLAKFLDL
ncbi:MAG: hypothetical protein M1836_006980 [Candelina mexicana]|nr:MAG: hypothetical protein M1836_006980 [Candelina mexicana]